MDIYTLLKNVFVSSSKHCVYLKIPNTQIDEKPPLVQTNIVAGEYYFRIWLAEMFLKDDRKLFKTFVPVVHSVVKFQFGEKGVQELPYIAGPVNLNLSSSLGKGVSINHALTNLLPFHGGSISIAAGLVAYQNKNYAEQLITTLNGICGLLNVGQLSSILKVVDVAVNGIQTMVSGGEKEIHLIYNETFAGTTAGGGNQLSNGYIAIIDAPAESFDQSKLFVKDSHLCFGDDVASAKPLVGYDYILLRIELTQNRDDLQSFEEFTKLLYEAVKKGIENKPEEAQAILNTLRLSIIESEDLIAYDKIIAYQAFLSTYNSLVNTTSAIPVPSTARVARRLAATNIIGTTGSKLTLSRLGSKISLQVQNIHKDYNLMEKINENQTTYLDMLKTSNQFTIDGLE